MTGSDTRTYLKQLSVIRSVEITKPCCRSSRSLEEYLAHGILRKSPVKSPALPFLRRSSIIFWRWFGLRLVGPEGGKLETLDFV